MNDRERDDDVAVNEWRAKFDEHIDSGGCLEAAQAASEERERTETRRGVVRKIGTAMATVVGIGATSETVQAAPEWPVTPHATTAYCTGEIKPECIAAVATSTGTRYGCIWEPTHLTCVPCATSLLGSGIMAPDDCCEGGTWVQPGEDHE